MHLLKYETDSEGTTGTLSHNEENIVSIRIFHGPKRTTAFVCTDIFNMLNHRYGIRQLQKESLLRIEQ